MIKKIELLQNAMRARDLSLVAVTAGPDLTYLIGLEFHVSERPVILLIPSSGQSLLIHPELETMKVKRCAVSLSSFPYGESKSTWWQVCAQALKSIPTKKEKIGVISTHMRYLEMELLHKAEPALHFQAVDELFQMLRMHKDDREITSIRKAIEIAESAFLATLKSIEVGRTEKEIAAKLVMNLFRFGSDPELPFSPIVASGPNAANPHAVPIDRALKSGDLMIIDWGASSDHYISDITRTISMGVPSEKFTQIASTVKDANTRAREFAKAGLPCSQVDATARAVITEAGFGEFFTHRTGHGIGMEAHEAPFIAADYPHPLEIGNTFTIEPGIYLPGEGGVRIEDNMVITESGAETLTTLPRDLFIIK
ncbi:MAG: aminopeptidase P family protein [Anaerolineaceae bacterium]|nr:MAG: aminopeptidase P family protein [Anaerolineaceae bacterium]